MSPPDWQELERLWQSSPAAAQSKDLVARLHRRPWLRYLTVASEIVATIATVTASIFIMLRDRPDALLIGISMLLLSLFAGGATLWARMAPRAAAEQSVTTALDIAIHRLRVRVRLALASFWVVGASLFVIAFIAFLWAQTPEPKKLPTQMMTIVIWCAWIGLCQFGTIIYYQRRARELQRLETIRDEL